MKYFNIALFCLSLLSSGQSWAECNLRWKHDLQSSEAKILIQKGYTLISPDSNLYGDLSTLRIGQGCADSAFWSINTASIRTADSRTLAFVQVISPGYNCRRVLAALRKLPKCEDLQDSN